MHLSLDPETAFQRLLDVAPIALAEKGWGVFDNAFPAEIADALWLESRRDESRRYRPAGTGRDDQHHAVTDVRSDDIQWLKGKTEAECAYLARMEALRTTLNRELFLGLFDYECLFARYLEGARYRTHLDAFTGERNRVLSTVLYLNKGWQAAEGGELVLYEGDGATVLSRVLPEHNRLLMFLSEGFPHEVLPTHRVRFSLTGWFRVNSSEGWKRPV